MKNGVEITYLALIVTMRGSYNTWCSKATVIVDNIWAKDMTRQLEVTKVVFPVSKTCEVARASFHGTA